ncbi:thiamine ABC transporter substrate-binding protein [Kingella negevensis]|uniref:thiamine ABC transporter substrate-binding protein n=1 Tax=Kingella negevensis TaxID=1522312 RepID=UPI002542D673|nr:thiamine ABC transporter substrate-binding protein [Kingella negevensis]WII93863.1 thiamine ABC transporter substrate-binding protein [Kingella negevensis]
MKTIHTPLLILAIAPALSWAVTEMKLAVHDSYDLPKSVIAKFEQENDAKISVIKMGDGNAMLNRLILMKNGAPLADAVFGLDNNTAHKAKEAGILANTQPESAKMVVKLPYILAVDYGFVTLNYDKRWFAEKKLPLPKNLADLTQPQYKNLLAMPNPATSTPGLAFLMANIAGLGEEGAFQWWGAMRQNGVKITKGWSEAYNSEFTLNGGSRPIIVGYSSSPAAEVFYSEGKLKSPNMGNLFLNGGSYLQIEGAAVLNNAKQPELAAKLVRYMQSPAVQESVTTSMWVFPAVKNTKHDPIIRFASAPNNARMLPANQVNAKQKEWVERWIRTVLK